MPMLDGLRELSNTITELEVAIQKAWVMAGDLSGEYFELKENSLICLFHGNAGVKNSISCDYIVTIAELIKTARNLLEIEWNAAKAQNEKEKSLQSSNE